MRLTKFVLLAVDSHWDHTAFPFDRFPTAEVIAGPTTVSHTISLSHENYSPAHHPKPLELSWSHSPTHVLTFRHSHDLFSDGSILVVPTPGHTPGHVALVARTSIEAGHEEYVVLAGDCAHHPFCLSNKPQDSHYRFAAWRQVGEPTNEPAKHSMHEDYEEAENSLERLKALEKRDEFMVVLAHDFKRWNAWKKDENGCVELTGWRKKGLKH